MRKVFATAAVVTALSMSSLSHAHLQNDITEAYMSFVGPHSVQGAPGSILPQRFAVRIVNGQGHPIPGLSIMFGANRTHSGDPGCTSPCTPTPTGIYGEFLDEPASHAVITDANGVATAPAFKVGRNPHEVFVLISTNAVSRGMPFPRPTGLFHINMPGVVEPPQTPIPVAQPIVGGTPVAPTSLPSTTTWGVMLLALGVAGLATRRLRVRSRG